MTSHHEEELQRRRPRVSGRRLLISLGLLSIAVLAAFVTRSIQTKNRDCADLGSLRKFELGTVVHIPCIPAYVVNVTGTPVVFLAESTHLPGEPISWDQNKKLFVSLHDETFDVVGNVASGPAPRPLWRCPTVMRDGQFRIAVPERSSKSAIVSRCRSEG